MYFIGRLTLKYEVHSLQSILPSYYKIMQTIILSSAKYWCLNVMYSSIIIIMSIAIYGSFLMTHLIPGVLQHTCEPRTLDPTFWAVACHKGPDNFQTDISNVG